MQRGETAFAVAMLRLISFFLLGIDGESLVALVVGLRRDMIWPNGRELCRSRQRSEPGRLASRDSSRPLGGHRAQQSVRLMTRITGRRELTLHMKSSGHPRSDAYDGYASPPGCLRKLLTHCSSHSSIKA